MSDRRAFILPPGDWSRRLHAPWTLIMQQVSTGDRRMKDAPFIESVIGAVLSNPPVPMRDTRVLVLDADGWVAFGYSTDPEFIATNGHDCWMGSEFGFAVAESLDIIDPVTLGYWESIARSGSDVDEWWRQDT